ncbi:protoheme IX farnesyltransferase mitochondrial [Clonorchis sinensis]|uniref:Protoheme IX farnesyltransferase, mitochondrial n=1 Tax=Clonorchis sinensis TaxID=79923 RepID=G7YXI5_CLOSI|nr:protoheme IX farnesyltransferase mitochondrial [Clonorchis sinensis]
MGFRHLPLFFLVSRSPHAPTLSKQPTRVILCGRHRSMGYSRRYPGLLQLETQSAVSSGSAEQTQSKRLGAPISQISLTPTSVPQSTTDRGIPLESLSVTVGSHTFPEEDSLPSLNNSFLYSTTGSRERMATDPPVTSSVCPVLTSPEQILVPTIPQSLNRSLEVAAGLSKARLSLLVVSTAVVGCVLAASTSLTSPLFLAHPYRTILCLIVGTGLTSAAANTVNQIVEIPYDSQMMRTRDRVLVRGLTNPGRAGLFALGCAGTGLITLCLGTNPLVVWLAAGNMLLYTTLYTPLKQFSQANTWIGALVGGVPPLMGWAAATGEIHSGSLILASLLYVWQFPHFMALSWNLRGEYSKAGYMMTSVLEPPVCKQVALRYAVACSLVCLAGAGCSAISLGPWAGCALGLTCLPPNIGLIYYAWQFSRADSQEGSAAAARRLFRSTLLHLPIVMTAALIGTYICGTTIGAGQ